MKKSNLLILIKYEFLENLRNNWLYLYFFISFAGALSIIALAANEPNKATASLLSLSLLMIPLFSLLFSGLSFADSVAFLETVIVRKVSRPEIFLSKYLGQFLGMSLVYTLAYTLAGLFAFRHGRYLSTFVLLVAQGILLHAIFSAFAMLLAGLVRRKDMLIAVLLCTWFYFYIVYDLLIMTVGVLLGDYPIEGVVLGMFFLNPLDLVRMEILLNMDLAALLGFGAAMFQHVFGGISGVAVTFIVLLLWAAVPFWLALRYFKHKDL
ncbi:MAG: ABC transporter permease subunit [Spirochaetes bacterium]|nr:ABC transporter permease subunit [Spirochaetota bacterium]